MKNKYKYLLIIVSILLLFLVLPNPQYSIQYYEGNSLVTETFKDVKELNKRAKELKLNNIEIYVDSY